MENTLKRLFDFQKFNDNPRLAVMLEEAEKRYAAISDDDLELISAAGETNPDNPLKWEEPDDERK